jgi:CheY-like chemotaxis protein
MRFTKEQLLSPYLALVLLVDDDDDVRETSADMLEELGYRVVQATNAYEALGKLEQCPELAVMVTDVRMPGMSGLELLRIAGERYHGLKIILMSGYFTPQPLTCRFLQKPFRTTELDAAIQAELSDAAS